MHRVPVEVRQFQFECRFVAFRVRQAFRRAGVPCGRVREVSPEVFVVSVPVEEAERAQEVVEAV